MSVYIWLYGVFIYKNSFGEAQNVNHELIYSLSVLT